MRTVSGDAVEGQWEVMQAIVEAGERAGAHRQYLGQSLAQMHGMGRQIKDRVCLEA